MDFEDFLKKINHNGRTFKGADLALVKQAFEFAKKAHQNQKRASGEPFLIHPLKVAQTLSEMNLDVSTIVAALLHDTVEDCGISPETIENNFGKEAVFLVNGVTKLGKIQYRGVEKKVENLRKMLLAMAEDIRVVLIKLADRLHNMQTLGAFPEAKQKRIALETLEIYAPLANRLGMGELKGQLEDLAFPYIYPKEYRWLMSKVTDRYQERQAYLEKVKPIVETRLIEGGVKPLTIDSRAKHYYSLHKKLLRYGMNIEEIHDLVALRVIVENIEKCYAALGIIHELWTPLSGRIKDYIAVPKPNGYQSLHTTVFCADGKITEIQIRTPDLHQKAEYGIAAHWAYSEKKADANYIKTGKMLIAPDQLAWVQQLREWQKETRGSAEFLESLKIDFFRDRIFVFTPKGDVIDLPEGATPVDFAYHIHTDIGHQCAGAKINGKLIGLDRKLFSGDVVEILTQKNKKPSDAWLGFVKTNLAREKIKDALRAQARNFIIKKPLQREASLILTVKDRIGLIKDVSSALSRARMNIVSLNTPKSNHKNGNVAVIRLICSVKDKRQLENLIIQLKEINGIEDIVYDLKGVN